MSKRRRASRDESSATDDASAAALTTVVLPGGGPGSPAAPAPAAPAAAPGPRSFGAEYEIGDVLGHGTFSIVRRCRHRATGATRAVKIIDVRRLKRGGGTGLGAVAPLRRDGMGGGGGGAPAAAAAAAVTDEVAILQALHHEKIIKVFDIYDQAWPEAPLADGAAAGSGGAAPLPLVLHASAAPAAATPSSDGSSPASAATAPAHCVLIVTEFAPGGELFDSIIKAGNFTEAQVRLRK